MAFGNMMNQLKGSVDRQQQFDPGSVPPKKHAPGQMYNPANPQAGYNYPPPPSGVGQVAPPASQSTPSYGSSLGGLNQYPQQGNQVNPGGGFDPNQGGGFNLAGPTPSESSDSPWQPDPSNSPWQPDPSNDPWAPDSSYDPSYVPSAKEKKPQVIGSGSILSSEDSYDPVDPNGDYQTGGVSPNWDANQASNSGQLQISQGNLGGGNGQGEGQELQFLDTAKHQLDPRYMNELRGIAYEDPGQSPWLKYQMDQDKLRQDDDRDSLASQGSSNMATQQGNMAMRGGLTSGATERLGSQNLMGQLQGNQALSRGAAGREGAYRQQAEQRQRNVLTQLPGWERNYSQYGADLDKYNVNQNNQAWAAQQTQNAINSQRDTSEFLPGADPSKWGK